MRPIYTKRKLQVIGDGIGGASPRSKLADPTKSEQSSVLDFSDSDLGIDSAQKVQTLPDCRPSPKEKNLLAKTKTSTKPAFSEKTHISFPEIATARGKLYHPPLPVFEKNIYEKNQRMIKMTKLISDFMAQKNVKRASSLSNQAHSSHRVLQSLNYVLLGKNPESNTTTSEQFVKRQSLPPPPESYTERRFNTDIEERLARMRLRHQNSIESSNSTIKLATFFKNEEKSKSPPRLYTEISQTPINKIDREKIKHYSRSPDERTEPKSKSLEKVANNFFVKNKDKFNVVTPLKKRAAELSKEEFLTTKAEWLKKALASHRAKLKPQFKVL